MHALQVALPRKGDKVRATNEEDEDEDMVEDDDAEEGAEEGAHQPMSMSMTSADPNTPGKFNACPCRSKSAAECQGKHLKSIDKQHWFMQHEWHLPSHCCITLEPAR